MNVITAINLTHQTVINRMYKADRAYHELVNLGDHFDGLNDEGQYDTKIRQLGAKQEAKFCVSEECWDMLPKREQLNANRQYKDLHGYGIV